MSPTPLPTLLPLWPAAIIANADCVTLVKSIYLSGSQHPFHARI